MSIHCNGCFILQILLCTYASGLSFSFRITFEQLCSSILSSHLTLSLDAHYFPIEASSLQNNVTTPLSIKGVFELQVACC